MIIGTVVGPSNRIGGPNIVDAINRRAIAGDGLHGDGAGTAADAAQGNLGIPGIIRRRLVGGKHGGTIFNVTKRIDTVNDRQRGIGLAN